MYCGRIKCPEVASFELVCPHCLDGESAAVTCAEVRKQLGVIGEEARAWREL